MPRQNSRREGGFSLLELLIVVAIIGILLAMYSGVLTKATRLAKSTATGEAMRQGNIGRMAKGDSGKKARSLDPQELRDRAQARFRQTIDTGKNDGIITQVLFTVTNDREFGAYYHTLLDPDNTSPLEFVKNDWLVAVDEKGRRFELKPISMANSQSPIGWEYLSTNPSEMGTGALVIQVQYGDGHLQSVRYPGPFPATQTVAELGNAFLR